MGRSRGLTGAPSFGLGSRPQTVVARLSASPLGALAVAGSPASRAPLAIRTSTGWPDHADAAHAALARTLSSQSAADEGSSDETDAGALRRRVRQPLRLSRATDAAPSAAVSAGTGLSPTGTIAPQPAAIATNGRTSTSTTPPVTHGRPASPNHSRANESLTGSAVTPPTSFETRHRPVARWSHESADSVRISPLRQPRSTSHVTSTWLHQLATGTPTAAAGALPRPASHTTAAANQSDNHPTHSPPAADSTRASDQPHDARHQPPLAPLPAIKPAAVVQPVVMPSTTPGHRSGSPTPSPRVQGLAGLAAHFADAESPAVDDRQPFALPAPDSGRELPAIDYPAPAGRTNDVREVASTNHRRSAADPLAEVEMGIKLAQVLGDALGDEARRAGIFVESGQR